MTKTKDETQQRRTLQLVKPLYPELDNPLPPARDDTRPAPRVAGDGLFPDEVSNGLTQSLTQTPCRVCNTRIATLAPARLCADCLGNLPATKAHVEGVYEKSVRALEDAETHVLACAQCAPAKAQERWGRAKTLLAAGPASEAFVRTWQVEIAAKSALGAILVAYDALQTAEQSLCGVTEWTLAAMSEIEQAEALARQDEDYAAALALVREAVTR